MSDAARRMNLWRAGLAPLLLAATLFGCGTDTGADAGPADDGAAADAGANDAGANDAGDDDAGDDDAGDDDAGDDDAGTDDAGTTDAGTNDAGVNDAGIADAGTADAGTADAGPDAGPPLPLNHEPDNTLAEADVFGALTEGVPFRTATANDFTDIYRIEVPRPTFVDARLSFVNADGNLLLTLRDSTGAFLRNANIAADVEFVSFEVTTAGTYYLEVGAHDLPRGNTYELVYTLVDASSAGPHEHDDTPIMADTLGPVTAGSTVRANAEDPVDLWVLEVPAGRERVTLSLAFTHADGDLQLFLTNGVAYDYAASVTTGDVETIDQRVPDGGGTFYAVVYAPDPQGNTYDLTFDTQVSVLPDAHEPDNDFAMADARGDLAPDTRVTGTLDSIDIYRIAVPLGRTYIDIQLEYLAADGDASLAIGIPDPYDAGETMTFGDADTAADDEALGMRLFEDGGTYYIEVISEELSSAGMAYTLSYSLSAMPVTDDSHEPDDDLTMADAAGVLPESMTVAGTMTDDVGDVYLLANVVAGMERVNVTLEYDPDMCLACTSAEGDILFLALYDDTGTEISFFESYDGLADMFVVVPGPGTYYVEVVPVGPAQATAYTLSYELEAPLAADTHEPDGTIAQADARPTLGAADTTLMGTSTDLEDLYRLDVAAGREHVVIDLAQAEASGDLELYLLNSAMEILRSSEFPGTRESIVADLSAAASPYYVAVRPFVGVTGGSYTLRALTGPSYLTEDRDTAADLHEPDNDVTSGTARGVLVQGTVALGSTSDMDDFYLIELPASTGLVHVAVDLAFNGRTSDIDVFLEDGTGFEYAASESDTHNEGFSVDVDAAAGPYFIRVAPWRLARSGRYRLTYWTSVLP